MTRWLLEVLDIPGAYRKWGWSRVGVLRPGWEGAPQFDALVRSLPG
ncbi:hypothetical protein [Nocardia sp. NBC_00416]